MNGNYPPGVTGNEKEIIGEAEIEWDIGSFTETDRLDDYTSEGIVSGYRDGQEFKASAIVTCGKMEVNESTAEAVQ